MADLPPSSEPGAPPGNVYHKEKKHPRHRDRSTRLESGAPLSRPTLTRNDNPARVTLVSNLRRFALAAGIMAVVLYVTIKGLNMMDARYAQKFTPPPDTGRDFAKELLPEETRTPPLPVDEGTQSATVTVASSSEDYMRQGAFLARRGKNLEAEGQYLEAIARYREALELWPYQPYVWAQLGRLHLRVGDLARAQTALERAVNDDPAASQLLNDLGVVYYQQGNIASAINSFAAYAEFDPTSAPAYFNLSLCYLARNEASKARNYLDRYLALQPDDARALRQVAYLDAATNNLDGARTALQKAIEHSPDWALLHLDAAAVEARSTNAQKTVEHLLKASELTSPLLVQRIYANAAFNGVRNSDSARSFEKDLLARVAKADAAITSETVVVESPGPISSVSPPP